MSRNKVNILGTGRFLRLVSNGEWEYCERLVGSGVAIIIASFDNKIILTEQFRPPLNASVIELPAGIIGDLEDNEEGAKAANRELEEETGFRATSVERLIEGPISSGLTSETLTFFRAKNLSRVGKGGGDSTENIRVHEVPLENVEKWLAEQQDLGLLVDPKIFVALYFLNRESAL